MMFVICEVEYQQLISKLVRELGKKCIHLRDKTCPTDRQE